MAMVGRPAVDVPAIFLMARQETTDDAQTSGHCDATANLYFVHRLGRRRNSSVALLRAFNFRSIVLPSRR
eukprot:scaffold13351_cov194-Alexandrium_tamarense.AAC.11